MEYFKIRGEKISKDVSYDYCLGLEPSMTKERYFALTGLDADTGKKTKPVKKKAEKKKKGSIDSKIDDQENRFDK